MKQDNFALGEFATLELLKHHFKSCKRVIISSNKYKDKLKGFNINIKVDPNYIKKIIKKEDIYIISEFTPYNMKLDNKYPHILLSNINDEGEIGTILRTAVAFNFKNIVLINSNVDIFSSKLIRASTGALFMLNVVKYNSKADYIKDNKSSKYIEIDCKNNKAASLEVSNILYKNRLN